MCGSAVAQGLQSPFDQRVQFCGRAFEVVVDDQGVVDVTVLRGGDLRLRFREPPFDDFGGFALAVGLTIPGAMYWGIEGAATGYAVSTILLFICFNLKARQLRRELLRGLGRTDLAPLI